jgi:hypothetical protein
MGVATATPTSTLTATPTSTSTATATSTLTPTPTPTATPEPQIRISESPLRNPYIYVWDPTSGNLFQGSSTADPQVVFFDIAGRSGRVHQGANATGEIAFFVDFLTSRIWVGSNPTGPLAYTLEPVSSSRGPIIRVRRGNEAGPILYTINGEDMHEGPNETGRLIYRGSLPFRGPIQFLLVLLAEGHIP